MHLIHTPIITHSCSKLWLWGVEMSSSGRSISPGGTTVCVSESDLVLCHTELQACLQAKFSLEGHETQRCCISSAPGPRALASNWKWHHLLHACRNGSTHTHTHTPAWHVSVRPSLSSPSLLRSFSSFMFSSPSLHPSACSDSMR